MIPQRLVSFLFFISFLFLSGSGTAQVTLEVHSIEVFKGNLFIAIYDSEATFLDDEELFRGAIILADKETLTYDLSDLAPGDYAIAVYHDENDNKEMDMGLFGIPKENYGFSNNAPSRFGPPSYADASFTVAEQAKKIQIKLR